MRRQGTYRWVIPVLAVILAVDTELYSMARQARREALEQARVNLRVAADVVLGRAEQKLDTYDRTLSGISEVVSLLGQLATAPDLPLHRLLVRRHAITPGLRWLSLVRGDGQLAESSVSFPAPDLNVAEQEYFQSRAKGSDQGLFIGAPMDSPIDHSPFIPLSRRLVNDGNRSLGVIAAGLDPESLTHLLADQALPAGYTLRLILDNGRALACLPADAPCRERDWAETPVFPRLVSKQAGRGYFDSSELSGPEPGLGAFAGSDRYPVLVVTAVDEARVLGPWRDGLLGYMALVLVSNAALAGIAFFAFRQFQRREQAMEALAEANQHLEERVASRTDQLRLSEAQARTFMNTAMDAVVVINGEDHIVEFNQAAENLFGYTAAEAKGCRLEFFIPAEGFEGLAAMTGLQGREAVGRNREGQEFPIEVTVGSTGKAGMPLYVAVVRDISERKETERELKRLATVDGLTGLLNRRAFTEQAEKLVSLARRHGRPLALMILDADKFKNINDTYGHPAGDEVLKALADTLARLVRTSDLLGRLGGEEFGIALPETDLAGAWELGNRILEAIRACRVHAGGRELAFTASIGVTMLSLEDGDDLEAATRRADEALYRAKGEGRDRLVATLPLEHA